MDHVHTFTRAGLGSLPVVGNAAVELFNSVVTPPLERRRDEWRKSVGERLERLEIEKRLNLEKLGENDEFIDAVLKATQAAMRTSHEEKLEALRNAVVNTALSTPIRESLQQIFIQWVDELTADHIRFLELFRDPPGWFSRHGKTPPQFAISSSLSQLLEHALPDIAKDRQYYNLIAADLEAKRLFSGGMHTMMSVSGAWSKRTTDLGDQFIDYVSPPKPA